MNRDVPIAERDPVVHVPCSWQMPDPEWSPYPPDVDAIRAAGGQAYYWVRGWNFVTPVMAEVVLITHSDPPEQCVIVRRVGEQTLDEPARSPRFTNLELLPNWYPLEWAGPVAGASCRQAARHPDVPSCHQNAGGEA